MRKSFMRNFQVVGATALFAGVFNVQAADITNYELDSSAWFAEAVAGQSVGELATPWSKEGGTASVVEESSVKSISMLDANVKYTPTAQSSGPVTLVDFTIKAAGLEIDDAVPVTDGEQARFALINDGSDNLSYRAFVRESAAANAATNWVELTNADLDALSENVAYEARAAIDYRTTVPRIAFYVKKGDDWKLLSKKGSTPAVYNFYTMTPDTKTVSNAAFVGTGNVNALAGTKASIKPVYNWAGAAGGDWSGATWTYYDEATDHIPNAATDIAVLTAGASVQLTGAVQVAELRVPGAATLGGSGTIATPAITGAGTLTFEGVTVKAVDNVLTVAGAIKLAGGVITAFNMGTGTLEATGKLTAEGQDTAISVVAGSVTAASGLPMALGTEYADGAYKPGAGVSEKKEVKPEGEPEGATIVVPQDWTAKTYTGKTNPATGADYTQAEAEAALNDGSKNANGYKGWESYALGLDPTDADSRPLVEADVGKAQETTTIGIRIANITPNLDAVESIAYQLQKSTNGTDWTNVGSAVSDPNAVQVANPGSAYYRVLTKITLKTAND